MPRPKAFDVETALKRAQELFWREGFDAASLKALLRAMGISRQSLYDTFGDKRGLYLRALERYAQARAANLAPLEATDASLAAIATYLRDLVAFLTDVPTPRGCMLTQATVEFGPGDAEVRALAQAHIRRFEIAVYRIADRAWRLGELGGDRDPGRIASFLACTREGLSVLARGGAPRGDLDAALEVALAAVGWRPPAAAPPPRPTAAEAAVSA